MTINLVPQMIILWSLELHFKRERLLSFADDKAAWLIDIDDPKSLPLLRSCSTIEKALEEHKATEISEPFIARRIKNRSIAEQYSIDRRWHTLERLIKVSSMGNNECSEARLYDAFTRGQVITDTILAWKQEVDFLQQKVANLNLLTANTHDIQTAECELAKVKSLPLNKNMVYKILRLHWQRGVGREALIPDLDNCGASGKMKPTGDKKRGRPCKISQITQEDFGINLGKVAQAQMQQYYKSYYLHIEGKKSLKKSYDLMIEQKYNAGHQYINGVLRPIIPPQQILPSFNQFLYYGRREVTVEEHQASLYGQKSAQKDHHAKTGSTRNVAFGPGHVFQTDAAWLPLYLVHSYNPSIQIGKANAYLSIDVFSSLIASVTVTLEQPSWGAFMLHLEDLVQDKVALCHSRGIQISAEKWPFSGSLPHCMVVDRGIEYTQEQSNYIAGALNITLTNTPAYRPDLKPLVESAIKHFKTLLFDFIVDEIHIKHERGSVDPKLDACLTIEQLERIVLKTVIYHNNHFIMETYPLTPAMRADGVLPIPIDIWNWGMHNRSGRLSKNSLDEVRVHVLPRRDGVVTERGIRFAKKYYTCSTAEKHNWFAQSERKGIWNVELLVHPLRKDMDSVFIRLENGTRIEQCTLTEGSRVTGGMYWAELAALESIEILQRIEHEDEARQARANLRAEISQEYSQAKAEVALATDGMSKSEFSKDIRENRTSAVAISRENLSQPVLLTENSDSQQVQTPESEMVIKDAALHNRIKNLQHLFLQEGPK